jgi:succinoglycan biosynthesis protein ExoM
MPGMPHISICICTYKREELLKRALDAIRKQQTGGLFTFSIVVCDNDPLASAQLVVSEFAAASAIPVKYCAEPRQSICLARNKAIENATGDYIAFIDDDEFPTRDWLFELARACDRTGAAGVLGPVKRHFDEEPPNWIIKGRFYERPTHPTGFVIDWREGRTGNLLLRKSILQPGEPPFDPTFHRGGDVDFFRRMVLRGHVFIWCDEAVVYEVVPPKRWTRTFMLRRALLRGTINAKHGPARLRSVLKSVLAVPVYVVALPFALALGQHRFMSLSIKLCDHLGKLLATIGVMPVKNQFITD